MKLHLQPKSFKGIWFQPTLSTSQVSFFQWLISYYCYRNTTQSCRVSNYRCMLHICIPCLLVVCGLHCSTTACKLKCSWESWIHQQHKPLLSALSLEIWDLLLIGTKAMSTYGQWTLCNVVQFNQHVFPADGSVAFVE